MRFPLAFIPFAILGVVTLAHALPIPVLSTPQNHPFINVITRPDPPQIPTEYDMQLLRHMLAKARSQLRTDQENQKGTALALGLARAELEKAAQQRKNWNVERSNKHATLKVTEKRLTKAHDDHRECIIKREKTDQNALHDKAKAEDSARIIHFLELAISYGEKRRKNPGRQIPFYRKQSTPVVPKVNLPLPDEDTVRNALEVRPGEVEDLRYMQKQYALSTQKEYEKSQNFVDQGLGRKEKLTKLKEKFEEAQKSYDAQRLALRKASNLLVAVDQLYAASSEILDAAYWLHFEESEATQDTLDAQHCTALAGVYIDLQAEAERRIGIAKGSQGHPSS